MQRVITINLNGRAYQLDESAYDALRAYLNRADVQLQDNPDRAEITADLEAAIAEKCNRFLGAGKTVISAAEMQQVIEEMGPVEGPDARDRRGDAATGAAGQTADGAPRRLYRIHEGAIWRGVCTGLAAYLAVDVAVIRIIFIVLAAVSFGWGILGYFVLAHIIPEAYTSDERAAAHGQPPFNAREIIDQAKRAAEEIAHGARESATAFKGAAHQARDDWKRQWRAQRREWRAEHRAWRRQWRGTAGPRVWDPPSMHAVYAPPSWAVWMMPVFSLISLTCFVFLAMAVVSLVSTGFVYGWALPDGVPLWVGVLMLVVFYHLVTSPLRLARHAYYRWGYGSGWFAAWDSVSGLAVAGILLWVLLRHMPPVHDFREFVEYLPEAFRALGREVSVWWQRFAESF